MVCPTCASAADRLAPRDQHCTDPGCTCGHRAERYTTSGKPAFHTSTPNGGGDDR